MNSKKNTTHIQKMFRRSYFGVNFARSDEACNSKLPSKCEESLEVFPADSLTQTSPSNFQIFRAIKSLNFGDFVTINQIRPRYWLLRWFWHHQF